MWSTALWNIVILPFLLLISIPLAVSASVTAALALTTLFMRALVVYFELVIALLANFFLFPAHSPASGTFLALTEGSTPGIERTAPYARATKYGHQHTGLVKSRRESSSPKEGVVEDYFFQHKRSVRLTLYSHLVDGKPHANMHDSNMAIPQYTHRRKHFRALSPAMLSATLKVSAAGEHPYGERSIIRHHPCRR